MTTSRAAEGIKGRRLGGEPIHWQSDDVELAPRVDAPYNCPNDHSFSVPFAEGVDIPDLWPCPHCGRVAVSEGAPVRPGGQAPPPGTGKTHFDQLLARRSREDGEKLLDEALARLAAERPARG